MSSVISALWISRGGSGVVAVVVGAEVAGWVGENVGDATGSGHKLRGKLRIGQKPEGFEKKVHGS